MQDQLRRNLAAKAYGGEVFTKKKARCVPFHFFTNTDCDAENDYTQLLYLGLQRLGKVIDVVRD